MSKILELEKGKLEIKNQTNDKAELLIYGEIVSSEWGKWQDTDVAPTDVRNFLDELNCNELDIYINSPGGSVFAGMAIYNMLKRKKCVKNVYVDGLAASVASVIAMAGDNIYIPHNAFLMIHKAWNITYGNANELRKEADTLDTIDEGILNVYKEKLKENVDIEEIKTMVANETWLTGEEAEKYFNINVIESNEAVACIGKEHLKNYKNIPKALENKIESKIIENTVKGNEENGIKIEYLKAKLELLLL